jgi:hypothetical protein
MRTAEPALEVMRERGKRGLPLEDIYRQLYNPQLYFSAPTAASPATRVR